MCNVWHATVHQLVPYMHASLIILKVTGNRIPCSSNEPRPRLHRFGPIMMRAREGDLAAGAQEELSVVFCLFETETCKSDSFMLPVRKMAAVAALYRLVDARKKK